MENELIQMSTKVWSPFWGIWVPLLVMIISFVAVWLLYLHFSK